MSLLWIILTVVLTSTLAIILKLLLQNNGKKGPRLPPGPREWPILRSIFSASKPHSSNTLGDFRETQISRYGKIFTMEFGGERNLVSADAEFSRFVLLNEMKLFENNHPKHMRALTSDTALAFLRGDAYRVKKSVILAFLHSLGTRSSFIDRVEKIAARQMSAWQDKDVVHIAEEAGKYSFNTIAELATGVSMADHPEIEQLNKDATTFHSRVSAAPINLPGTPYYQALQARERIWKFVLSIIKEREVDKKNRAEKTDLIDYLMFDTSYTHEEISDTVILMFSAAHYTIATVLSVAIHFLQSSPKAIEQLREEIQQFIELKDNRKMTWDDYKNMEFTQSVINESLRIGNVAPFLFKRALKDIEFKGCAIAKGTPIMTDIAAMHLDPSVFENPSEFNPWRWLGEDGKKKFNSFMPFGGGLRYCPARDMAKMEISIFLHHLVLNYDWEPAEPDEPIASPKVEFPKGLPMRICARNSSY